jgi:hypothetical protein
MNGVLKRMKGEELLLLAVSGNARVRHEVDGELDRRARPGRSERDRLSDFFWAGRNLAMRHSAIQAA